MQVSHIKVSWSHFKRRKFEEDIQESVMKEMIQGSMDGPNVNWKLGDSIVEEKNQNDDYSPQIDIGSL